MTELKSGNKPAHGFVNNIPKFLEGYREFSARLYRQKLDHWQTKFDGLFAGYRSLRAMLNAINREKATRYNIFDVVRIENKEKTHTSFLINLLNPEGSHGQSDLFLRSFIETFVPKSKRHHFILADARDYVVEQEKHTPEGRIDISIHSINPKKRFGIIIENKWNTGGHSSQLERYYRFLRKGYEDNRIIMVYLTKEGHDPTEASIPKNLMDRLKGEEVLLSISHKGDIQDWLQGLLTTIEAPKVRHLVGQYIEIISERKGVQL